jgi:hypothetical protein
LGGRLLLEWVLRKARGLNPVGGRFFREKLKNRSIRPGRNGDLDPNVAGFFAQVVLRKPFADLSHSGTNDRIISRVVVGTSAEDLYSDHSFLKRLLPSLTGFFNQISK